ncbi:hypothetical protein BIY28_07900 [Brenneria goodwinii]|nr:hypothetical protein BIY28_07900 [Brenneria goodwinii]
MIIRGMVACGYTNLWRAFFRLEKTSATDYLQYKKLYFIYSLSTVVRCNSFGAGDIIIATGCGG